MNYVLPKAGEEPIKQPLVAIWHVLQVKFFESLQTQFTNSRWTNACMIYYDTELRDAYKYIACSVEISPEYLIGIYRTNRNTDMTNVAFRRWQCECKEFQEQQIPCRHAICVALYYNLDLEDYISNYYSITAYRATTSITLVVMPPTSSR